MEGEYVLITPNEGKASSFKWELKTHTKRCPQSVPEICLYF